MKILHIYSSWTAGGAEKVMLGLAVGLEKKNLTNILACPKDSFLYNSAKKSGLKVYPLTIKGSFDPIGLWRLWRIVKKENIDILHAHQGKVFWPCIIMKALGKPGLKAVFHRHAQLAHRFYSRGHYHRADAIIAISRAVACGLAGREKVPAEKLSVVYNGTDFNRFNPSVSGREAREEYGLGNSFVIGTVAAMNKPKGKGQQYLIEAAALLKAKYPDTRYLIVGDGPLRPELEKRVKEAGLSGTVVFTGHRENVECLIAAMDVFCLLSWDTEGFGQVLVEAQGMGKAVIGTNVGGIPETLKDGITGYILPPENPEALARCIEGFLADRSRAKTMGNAGVEYVRGTFSDERMAEGVLSIYRGLHERA